MTFLETYNASFVSNKFEWPETVRDQAKMNLASHSVWRLFGNYFGPCLGKKNLSISNSSQANDLLVTSSDGLPLSYS